MKQQLFVVATALVALVACSRNQEVEVPEANLTLIAKTEMPAETKTTVEGGTHVFWEPGDEILVFSGEKSGKFVSYLSSSAATATFRGTLGEDAWPEDMDLWAVYPYSEEAVFDGETITTTLPSEQIARAGSFGKDMNLAIARSNTNTLQFYNVGGGLRFSVTEDGIKKVMFEGLSGEIISGKVKIGFDENGKPKVQEITGGSQFITLLPPEGSETFGKNTWYYIVAIPGSLEKGYKFRFYKESDYARKVSEKAVVIKRSIFGNIEKADEGIEYESQTTHFPETEDEWKESLSLTDDINSQLDSRFNGLSSILEDESNALEDIANMEGIVAASLTSDRKCLSIMQKDSIIINYLLDISSFSNQYQSNAIEKTIHRLSRLQSNESRTDVGNSWFNNGINALVLAPVDGTLLEFGASVNSLVDALRPIFDDRITVLKGPEADLTKFYGDYLDNYDFIYINTHGGIIHKNSWFWEHMGELFEPDNEPLASPTVKRTALATGTKYDAQFIEDYIDTNILSKYSLYIMDIGDPEKNEHDLRVSMTPEFLEEVALVRDEASFDNTVVMMGVCHSAEIQQGEESLMEAFLNKGAAIYSGYTNTMSAPLNAMMSFRIVSALANGLSFQEAADYIVNSSLIKEYSESIDLWSRDSYKEDKYNECKPTINPHLFSYRINKNISLPYRFMDPYPLLINATQDGDTILFEWKSLLRSYTETWPYYYSKENYGNKECQISAYYELYVDGSKQDVTFGANTFTDKTATWIPSSTGNHTWYVIARIKEGDTVVASYQSETKDFTVTDQKPDPPQVETFPASVDAEKAFLSGMVTNRSQEGLETGFYYYKLTAQEEAMQLSENDKVRLVLGGKKILSAGDYKDYFGVDLKDIVQNSTYLFVAYATDEYDQTGRGAVLSFKTGSPSVSVSSVSLDRTRLELTVGSTATLVATVLPENATNKKVTWSSSDESKATVSSVGVVKGISKGNAVITVTTEDGRKTATCNVTVNPSTVHVESVSLNKTSLELTVGNTATLVATVLPENAANKSVTWSSSNSSKATVSSSGVVTGVAEGSAVITATTVDGGKTASCNVTVRQAATPEPKLSVSTRRLDFGNQIKFTQESKNITITNSGTGTLQITSISKTSNYGDLFQLSGWTSGGSIAAGASKTLTVSFQPLEERYYEETLTIVSSNSVGDKRVTVTLCGTGIPEAEDAVIQLSADELSWGDVEVGESVTKSFSVKNTGSTTLTISSIQVVATDNTVNPSYFAISPNGSSTVSPGKSKAFNVTFAPESVGGYYAIVSIKSNAKNATQGTSTVWLSGEGVAATSKVLTASPSSLSFGMQTVGNRTHKNFTVYNRGTKAVTLYSMEASDGFDLGYTWAEGSNLGMAAGSSKTFSIAFAPTEVRAYNGTITIKSNASGGDLIIPLSGTGVEAQGYLEIVSGESLDFGNVNLGTSGTLYTKIRNTGEAPLNILGITCPEGFSASCNATSLKEGYNTSISISFTPTQAKAYRGSVIVNTDAENGSVSIDVSGTGKQSSTGNTFVDMGLSVRWASANVGASNPEEFGHYVAWAETATKTQYLEKNYKYYNADAFYSGEGYITKYCSSSVYGYRGYTDPLTMLTYEDDYAQTRLGGLARIPTRKEWEELKSNCTWLWTSQNGVNGYLVTSNINGNVIFLPAGGLIDYSNDDVNSVGYYWTSNLYHDETYAFTWELRPDKAWYSYRSRYKGLTVRAVEDYSAKPMIYIETTSLKFEGVKLGTTASKEVTIQNTGKGTLHITGIRSTKRISFDWTSASIAPGASKVLTVYYTPVKDPSLVIDDPDTWDMTTMTISSDARNDSDYTLYITGYGVANNGNIEGTEEDPWN